MTVPSRGGDPPIPPAPPAAGRWQEQFQAEVHSAVRFERGLALKALIALGVVALIVVIRLLVV